MVGLELQSFSGNVASFVDDAGSAPEIEYAATILWGDSTSSTGFVSPNGSGGFNVLGSHTYLQSSPYAVAVQIQKLDGYSAIAGSYASILALTDHARVQTVVSSSLTSSGTLTGATTLGTDTFDISANGSYNYTLNVSLIDGLYEASTTTYTGNLAFTLHESGQQGSSPFVLESFDLGELGSEGINQTTIAKDLEGTFTRLVNGTTTIDYLNKDGNDSIGDFHLSGKETEAVTIGETGVYGGRSYTLTESPTTVTLLAGSGHHIAGSYGLTRTVTAPTSTWTDTGTDYSDSYIQTGAHSGSQVILEYGFYQLATYFVGITGSMSGAVTEIATNGVANSTVSAFGTPWTISQYKNGNWNTGDYSAGGGVIRSNDIALWNGTNQTAGGNANITGSGVTTTTQTGNAFTGAYSLLVTDSSMGSVSSAGSNQTGSGSSSDAANVNSTLDQNGNVLTGAYILHAVTTPMGGGNSLGMNQTANGDSDHFSSLITTLDRFGNTLTGAYTIHREDYADSDGSSGFDDQTASADSTGALNVTSVLDEFGNTLTGAYIAHYEIDSDSGGDWSADNQTGSASGNGGASSFTIRDDFGNRIAGTYFSYQITTSEGESESHQANQTEFSDSTSTAVGTTIIDSSGNLRTGAYTSTEISTATSATTGSGSDARGAYTLTTTDESSATTISSGNTVTAAYSLSVTANSSSTATKTGGNGQTNYIQTVTADSASTLTETGNAVTGSYSRTASASNTTHSLETGDYQLTTFFSIDETATATSTQTSIVNAVTGAYSTTSSSTSSSIIDSLGNDANGSYDFNKIASTTDSSTNAGNSILGNYENTFSHSSASTSNETNVFPAANASFTENLSESYTGLEIGNSITGGYSRSEEGTRGSSLVDEFTDASGTFNVTQSTTGEFTRTETGNRVLGDYAKTEIAFDDYVVQQIAPTFTLDIEGTNTYNDSETGNTFTGNYTRIKTGVDAYAMEESGTTAGGAFTQTVTGEDEYTLQDTGNLGTGNYTRSITGEGTYDRVTNGPGATLPSNMGVYDYLWQQIGDPHSGTFSLTQTGDDRYDLLEAFKDVSNTQAGQTPGHMNVYPVGQTFVDPGPYNWRNWGTLAGAAWDGANNGAALVFNHASGGLLYPDYAARVRSENAGTTSLAVTEYFAELGAISGGMAAGARLMGGGGAGGGGGATAISGQGMTQPAIMRAFFTGQRLARTETNIAALRWYQGVARDVLGRYARDGYTGTGVATQTQRIQQIQRQLTQWGVAP